MEDNKCKVLRIKQLIYHLGIQDSTFAEEIGVYKSDMSKYLSGKRKVTYELLGKIAVRYKQINSAWLLMGVGDMLTDKESNSNSTTITVNRGGNINASNSAVATEGSAINISGRHDEQTSKPIGTPYFGFESAACGVLSGFGEALTANNSDGAVVIPTLQTKDGDIFLQTRGRSMIDTKCPERSIPEGAMVLVRRWTQSFIEWGEIYCLATTDGYVIKRLMPGSDNTKITCVSADADNYPSYEVPTSEIKAVGRVIAIVSTQLL